MKKAFLPFISIASLVFLLLLSSGSDAITITAAPNPVTVSQPVSITVQSIFTSPTPLCTIEISYGDSPSFFPLGQCPPPAGIAAIPCNLTASHTYASPGSYTITARSSGCFVANPPQPPDPATLGINVLCIRLTLPAQPPLPPGTVGQPYLTNAATVSGGQPPYTYALVGGTLPPGLALSPSGSISGTPTTEGTYPMSLRISDTCPIGIQSVTAGITIAIRCPALSFITSSLPAASLGQTYTQQLSIAGGRAPYSYSVAGGALPPGLTLSPSGLITGSPSAAGIYSFSVRATDSCGAGAQSVQTTFALTVSAAACSPLSIITASPLQSGVIGTPYGIRLQNSGGQAPLTYSLVSGSLPPGLTMTGAGLITGIPSTAGSYSFTVNVADSCPGGVQNVERAFLLVVASPSVSLSVSPSAMSIPRGIATSGSIAYAFSGSPSLTTVLQSDKGTFLVGDTAVGESDMPLSASIVNGSGRVSEPLFIPVGVSERAERMGTRRITYVRNFVGGGIVLRATVDIAVTTAAGAEFRITRLRLYFENNRPEITVKRNQPSVNAFAEISFVGSGLLQGYWEVDGRIISTVNRDFVYGQSITLVTPPHAPLPTFDEGTHVVRFVITNPAENLPFPEAIYFVTAEEWAGVPAIRLVSPAYGSELGFGPVTFSWEGGGLSAVFLVEFFEEGKAKPIFSAYALKREYLLGSKALADAFASGLPYRWRVLGLDTSGRKTEQSEFSVFSFKERAAPPVQGQ